MGKRRVICETCNGTGKVRDSSLETPKGSGATYLYSTCRDCNGEGFMPR